MSKIEKYIEKYSSGQIKIEGGYKEGKKSGKWVHYLPDGNLDEEVSYKDEILHGKYIQYQIKNPNVKLFKLASYMLQLLENAKDTELSVLSDLGNL